MGIIIFQFRACVCICMTHSWPCTVTHCVCNRAPSITCNNEKAFCARVSKKQPEWLWPPSNGKNVRMRWNSMVPMAWVLTDRGSLTEPERTNQSYLRRLSDQNNNRVIEREENSPGSSKERNDKVPGDGALWWLNVTTLWMRSSYYFVWNTSNKRRQNPSEIQFNTSRIFALDWGSTWRPWAEQRLERQRDQLEIMQVSCQHGLLGVGGGMGGWQRLTRVIIIWWTQ